MPQKPLFQLPPSPAGLPQLPEGDPNSALRKISDFLAGAVAGKGFGPTDSPASTIGAAIPAILGGAGMIGGMFRAAHAAEGVWEAMSHLPVQLKRAPQAESILEGGATRIAFPSDVEKQVFEAGAPIRSPQQRATSFDANTRLSNMLAEKLNMPESSAFGREGAQERMSEYRQMLDNLAAELPDNGQYHSLTAPSIEDFVTAQRMNRPAPSKPPSMEINNPDLLKLISEFNPEAPRPDIAKQYETALKRGQFKVLPEGKK